MEDVEEQATTLLIIIFHRQRHHRNNVVRKRKRFFYWVRDIYRRRAAMGEYTNLVREVRLGDSDFYFRVGVMQIYF